MSIPLRTSTISQGEQRTLWQAAETISDVMKDDPDYTDMDMLADWIFDTIPDPNAPVSLGDEIRALIARPGNRRHAQELRAFADRADTMDEQIDELAEIKDRCCDTIETLSSQVSQQAAGRGIGSAERLDAQAVGTIIAFHWAPGIRVAAVMTEDRRWDTTTGLSLTSQEVIDRIGVVGVVDRPIV